MTMTQPRRTDLPFQQAESHMDATESRTDRFRRRVGIWGAVPLVVIGMFLPLPLEPTQQSLLVVMTLVVALWLTEAIPIPVTALLGMALLVVFNVASPDEVFGAFGSTTVFLVIGAFLIARAMTVHGLDRRFALAVLSLPRVGNSTYRTAMAFGAVALIISGFVSSSATAAMLLPIGMGIAHTVGKVIQEAHPNKKVSQLRFSCLVMLSIAYGASVGGLLTPVSGPANLIGRGMVEQLVGESINFIDWMTISIPYIIVMGVVMGIVLCLVNKPEIRHIPGGQELFREQKAELGRMSFPEKVVLGVFSSVVVLWIAPSLSDFMSTPPGWFETFTSYLNDGATPIIGAVILFCIPRSRNSRERILSWQDAATIDWGTVLLVGAGLTLGTMMTTTDLATTLGNALSAATGVNSLFALTLLAVTFGLLISETVSNTASVGIVLPIILPIASAIGVDPMVPAMAGILAASSGAMLPISTPPNAIVYGSQMVPIGRMVKSGVVCDLAGIVLIMASAMTIMVAVFS